MAEPPKMRVIHVVLSMDCGGLERVVLNLAEQGRSFGNETMVACLERPGTWAPLVEEMGVRTTCLNKRPGLRPSTVLRLRRAFEEFQPDLIHTHQIGVLFYVGPAARAAGRPALVHTEHGKNYVSRIRTRLLGRIAGRYADRFFCVSRDVADEVIRYHIAPETRVHVVYNGIPLSSDAEAACGDGLRESLGIPADAPIIGTVGRLAQLKAQDVLIRAFARVRETMPAAHLLLVGDGPSIGTLRELAGRLNIAAQVHLVGYQPRPERYLRLMDVFSLTSRSEGTPIVVLEAWAAGAPVVASRVGGLPELIDHDRDGLLFDPGDEAQLARALLRVLEDSCLAAALRAGGRARLKSRFLAEHMVGAYQRHYLELLSARERHG